MIFSKLQTLKKTAVKVRTALESLTVLASVPPGLSGENVFNSVSNTIPVYVPDVDTYRNASWGGFTIFLAINIDDYKQAAIDEINTAKEGVSLSEDETAAINGYITAIGNVTTLSVENLTIIENARNAALAIINLRIAKDPAIAAINAAMQGVTLSEDETTAINGYITTINNVTELSDENLTIIENAKNAALAIISQAAIRIAREAALAAIEAAMQGETGAYIIGLAQQYINIINSANDVTTINNAKNTALAAINAAMGAYLAGKAEALGAMGTPCEDCPAVEVSNDNTTIILYNPKNVTFRKTNEANK